MSISEIYVLLTMDCEPADTDLTSHALSMSGSGPTSYTISQRSIEGYFNVAKKVGYPVTLFVHPESANQHQDLLLRLQTEGACLGLHLHPYKFDKGQYLLDLGAYSAINQQKIIGAAKNAWEDALEQKSRYFRAGYFSANDNTFQVLQNLGFTGGSVSCPGRVLPTHCCVWAGADLYPHRAHLTFRQLPGNSNFIEIPVSVDLNRAVEIGHAGQKGYEWLYIPSNTYNHKEITKNLIQRFVQDSPKYPVIVMVTHNDEDYLNSENNARKNLEFILTAIKSTCEEYNILPIGYPLDQLCDLVNKDE